MEIDQNNYQSMEEEKKRRIKERQKERQYCRDILNCCLGCALYLSVFSFLVYKLTVSGNEDRKPQGVAVINSDGVTMPNIKPCPNWPNCVSSADDTTDPNGHYISPYIQSGSETAGTGTAKITEIIKKEGWEVIEKVKTSTLYNSTAYLQWNYWHVVDTIGFFETKDDLEILLVNDKFYFRSCGRESTNDNGDNRKRVEKIKRELLSQTING